MAACACTPLHWLLFTCLYEPTACDASYHNITCHPLSFLVEAPPNVCTPLHLADAAAHIAALAPERFSLSVLDAAACADLRMGCYLGVAEASSQPPAFIHLTYSPPGGEAKKKARHRAAEWLRTCMHMVPHALRS
jgi:Cytosol aminopeptidase family, catalytic domain